LTEFIEPLGMRVLVRKDENRQQTKGGIVLPDDAEIPNITGRIVEVSVQLDNDNDYPLKKYDKVLFNPKQAIPVDLETDNLLFVVPVEDVVAVFRRVPTNSASLNSPEEPLDSDEDVEFDD